VVAKPEVSSEPTQKELLENLAKAYEVEKRFARGLEQELHCLRELSGEEVKRTALEKAWKVTEMTEQPNPPSCTGGSSSVQTGTVRDLVAAFEQRSKTGN
jgi:hypothetical protein